VPDLGAAMEGEGYVVGKASAADGERDPAAGSGDRGAGRI